MRYNEYTETILKTAKAGCRLADCAKSACLYGVVLNEMYIDRDGKVQDGKFELEIEFAGGRVHTIGPFSIFNRAIETLIADAVDEEYRWLKAATSLEWSSLQKKWGEKGRREH